MLNKVNYYQVKIIKLGNLPPNSTAYDFKAEEIWYTGLGILIDKD